MPIKPAGDTPRHLFMAFRRMESRLTREPLPEHWIELLHRIEVKEREGATDRSDEPTRDQG